MDISMIKFGENKPSELFAGIAEQAAQKIKSNKNANKQTQIRKFYDELAMWNEKVQLNREDREGEYKKQEVFIKMLKAKVAYAEGRKHIDRNFSEIFNRCIDQVNSAETLKYAKLFMEAVMGFCKLEEVRN
ncbi:CRISPR type III-A/MTUBE-associated protein Csm2 [Phocoenobacter uteri]|uniref:CRISPR system Cms protein Csm2 n=1 Tax=Phocoenobacter uteri TaxID=146806 RepID=A0A379C9Q7_9PAST|nr:type III-A CRISPR-associated protein Csm2 [Phocoenobacter uteri]SUB58387.1 CRISPR type III-A/MTUBE-associated protein Csm2 [Phocoenobacter uteri]